MAKNRKRKGINPVVIVVAIALIIAGGIMSIPRVVAETGDIDGDGVADQYDEAPYDGEITREVPPNQLDPDDPYYDPNFDEEPYEPDYPDPKPIGGLPSRDLNIFSEGGGEVSFGNMLLFIGIGLFFIGIFIGRK